MKTSRNLVRIWLCLSMVLLAATVAADESRPVRGLYLEPGKTAADFRNVALNPADTTNREPVTFPHATSNSEYNQREFHDEVDNPGSFVETDLAAMLAYATYESDRGGWWPESYLLPTDRMRTTVRAKVDRFGFVQGVAGAPGFDHPGISTEGQAFFILMEAAARKAGRLEVSH